MSDIVKIGLIQATNDVDGNESVENHKKVAIEKHIRLVNEAKEKGIGGRLLAYIY